MQSERRREKRERERKIRQCDSPFPPRLRAELRRGGEKKRESTIIFFSFSLLTSADVDVE